MGAAVTDGLMQYVSCDCILHQSKHAGNEIFLFATHCASTAIPLH